MRIPTAILVAWVSCSPAWSQELVPNGSFEQPTACPFAASQIDLAAPWIAPTLGTSDYFNPCDATPDNVGVPDNAVGSQDAYLDFAYGGFIALSPIPIEPDYREYVQTPLVSGTGVLEAGKTYRFSMALSLAEDSSAATDRIGAYFSATPVGAGDFFELPYTPQVETPAGTFLDDTVEWMTFTETFVAAGGEQHLTIGNFHDAAGSAIAPAGFGPAPPLQIGTAYYYVDGVSVVCEPCAEPPPHMVCWWPLDELTGAVAYDVVSAEHGLHVGAPAPTAGYVDGALQLSGSGVAVPASTLNQLDTTDFTFDAWVRPDALGTVQTLFAKIPAPFTGPGYALVLNGDGTLAFTMVDAALGVATGSSTAALAAGEWSHVTVAVDRDDPAGGRIHVDGTVVPFDPTPAAGALTNALPLRFGQDGGAGVGVDFAGVLDEVELWLRPLAESEVQSVFDARTSGKCKIVLEITPVTAVPTPPGSSPTFETSGELTNGSGSTGTFTVAVRGDPAGTSFAGRVTTIDGPESPVVLVQQPIQVGPGQSVPVRFGLDVPEELCRGIASWSVTTTHLETGRTFTSRGLLRGIKIPATMQPR